LKREQVACISFMVSQFEMIWKSAARTNKVGE